MSSTNDDEAIAGDEVLAGRLQIEEVIQARRRRHSRGSHTTMLFVECVLGRMKQSIKLLVDTGASESVMSLDMAEKLKKLGLDTKLDCRREGNCQGVGITEIKGTLKKVKCVIGLAEMKIDFLVLEGKMPYVLLGLDQLRQFKCQIDLEQNELIFGGKDGYSVPFLSK